LARFFSRAKREILAIFPWGRAVGVYAGEASLMVDAVARVRRIFSGRVEAESSDAVVFDDEGGLSNRRTGRGGNFWGVMKAEENRRRG